MAYDESKYGAFLYHLRHVGIVEVACKRAGINKDTVYDRRNADAEFKAKFEKARGEGAALNLEEQAIKLAVHGAKRLKFNPKTGAAYTDPATGKPYVEREYHPQLLMHLLRATLPDQYGDVVRHEIGRKSDDDLIELLASDKELLRLVVERGMELGHIRVDGGDISVFARRVARQTEEDSQFEPSGSPA